MRRIVRTSAGWGLFRDGKIEALRSGLDEVLRGAPLESLGHLLPSELMAPIGSQELWAAGVTYERSLNARVEESREPDIYERVYEADRPELLFKASAERVRGPNQPGCVRADSSWNVPEPELAVVLDAQGRIFGYTIADDLSSRSIEGENPLYLPQAKIYEGSAVLGPWIVPADDVDLPFEITLEVRRQGTVSFSGSTSTAKMHRSIEDLAAWLTRGQRFERGVILSTGTGIVPDESFSLQAGDEVEITIEPIGTLTHGVAVWPC